MVAVATQSHIEFKSVTVRYGTKVALGYAVAHPDHVDRLVLDSTVPLTGPDPFGLSTFAALPGALRADCGRSACVGITRPSHCPRPSHPPPD